MFSSIPDALNELFTGMGPVYLVLGVIIGLIVGVVPGIGGAQGLALLLPLTLTMNDANALILLLAVSAASSQGGAVSAILLNTPGEAANTASTFDGYQLTKRGEGAKALGAAASAGIFGSIVGIIILIALLPLGRWIVLQFSYADYFALALFGMAAVGVVGTGSSPLRSIVSGLLGLCVGTIGMSVVTGDLRYTFGTPYLFDGLDLVPVLIGLFAVSESLRLAGLRGPVAPAPDGKQESAFADARAGIMSTLRHWGISLKASVIGTIVGIVPGVGGTVANFLAYGWVARSVGDKGNFGKGDIRGVIAPEAANNGKEGGALLPTLIFGIPGSVQTAVLLAALTVHGLQAGPRMMLDAPDLVLLLLIVGVAGNALASFGSFSLVPSVGLMGRMQARLLGILLVGSALAGSYLNNIGMAADVLVALIFGLVGFLMIKGGYSTVMFTIGFVLGPIMERSFFQTVEVSGGTAFLTRPVSLVLILLALVVLGLPIVKKLRPKHDKAESPTVTDVLQLADEDAEEIVEDPSVKGWHLAADLGALAAFLFFFIGILGVHAAQARSLPEAYSFVGLVLVCVGLAPVVRRMVKSRRAAAVRSATPDDVSVAVMAGAPVFGGPVSGSAGTGVAVGGAGAADATRGSGSGPGPGSAHKSRLELGELYPLLVVAISALFVALLWMHIPLWITLAGFVVVLGILGRQRMRGTLVSAGMLAAAFWAMCEWILGVQL